LNLHGVNQQMPDSMHSFLILVRVPGILARVRKHAEIGLQRNVQLAKLLTQPAPGKTIHLIRICREAVGEALNA